MYLRIDKQAAERLRAAAAKDRRSLASMARIYLERTLDDEAAREQATP